MSSLENGNRTSRKGTTKVCAEDETGRKKRCKVGLSYGAKVFAYYTKGMMASIYDFFEEGNPRAEEDDLTWVLLETRADGRHRERVIDGFWEDDFVDEEFDWKK